MKKKTIYFIGTFLVIYLINFFIPRLMPGDPFLYMQEVSESASSYTEEELEELRTYYKLDKPLAEQFLTTLSNNLRGDFGQSIYYKQPVRQVIRERAPWTVLIMSFTLLFSLLFGIILAGVSVCHPAADGILYHIMSAIIEIPAYLVGILFLFLIAARIKWLPLSGALTPFAEYGNIREFFMDIFRHALIPLASLMVITIPGFYFTIRSSFQTVIGKKYVWNGKAKGLGRCRILFYYILLNAFLPVVAYFFMSVGAAIGGTMLVENVFAYPGLGTVIRTAVKYRDYPLLQGVLLLSTVLVMVCSWISELMNYCLRRKTENTDEA